METTTSTTTDEIDQLVRNAQTALAEYMQLDQEQVDAITKAMALAGLEAQTTLAAMAVEETGRGVFEDKVTKNIFATETVYHSIKYQRTVGVIEENEDEGFYEVAEPVGVVAGITPVTNPTSTALFKAIICAKTRNPIIFGFHPAAQRCSVEAARIVRDAAIAAGAPRFCVQWIEHPSVDATKTLMHHNGVALILATGGSGMVQSAYSSGKPALGVGPGNVPCFIDHTAKLRESLTDLILSKSFDNGMICASEQAALIEAPVYDEAVAFMRSQGCYFADGPDECARLSAVVINPERGSVNPAVVGKYPYEIAALAGITVPRDTKVLCCELPDIKPEFPLAREKLSPVLAVVRCADVEDGFRKASAMLELGGMGHTAVIHSTDADTIREFGLRMKTGRIVVNSPAALGGIGDVYNSMQPSLTLGCGSYGHNSTTDNVTATNLINKKKIAMRRVNMQWFKVPGKIYFEPGSVQYLAKMPDIHRALVVCDAGVARLGFLARVTYQLSQHRNKPAVEIFDEVEGEPDVNTVEKGLAAVRRYQPDVIIALGGGSAMDAAKAMWMLYENPSIDLVGMSQKFMDIRKRVYKIPRFSDKCKFVAIPTTSGTGSEVTSFVVISDRHTHVKHPIADYELTPDVAIVDPNFVLTVPPAPTADTGMDVLTHAVEAYVSVLASDFTDALAIKAIETVFKYLPRAYTRGASDPEAREKMHYASCMAGMAFTNAYLGINHSLAHQLGSEFNIAHGRANAVLMPHVIRYNGQPNPTKFAMWPAYGVFIAPERYQEIARALHLPADTPAEGVESLATAVEALLRDIGIPPTLHEAIAASSPTHSTITRAEYLGLVPRLALQAFNDQCTTANPRVPLVTELQAILTDVFDGVQTQHTHQGEQQQQ